MINKFTSFFKKDFFNEKSDSLHNYIDINNLFSIELEQISSDEQFVQKIVKGLLSVSKQFGFNIDFYSKNNSSHYWTSLINNKNWILENNGKNHQSRNYGLIADVFVKKTLAGENSETAEMIMLTLNEKQFYLLEMVNRKKYSVYYLIVMMQLEKLFRSYEQIKENKLLAVRNEMCESRLEAAEKKVDTAQRSIKRKIYELQNLVEASNEIYSILDFKQLINSALLTIIGQVGFQQAFMLMFDKEKETFSEVFQKGFGTAILDGIEFEASSALVPYFLKHRTPMYIERLENNHDLKYFASKLKELNIFIVAPLVYSERLQGIICAGEKLYMRNFTETDFEIFHILVNIISISIGNANLFQETKKLSLTDGMTNLHNYRYFEDRLNEEINRAKRHSKKVSLMILDIDHFKNYNDTLGHQAGDTVLRHLGKLLKATIRDEDIVARYGGEEFCIILPGIQKDGIAALGERVRSKIEFEPFHKEEIQPGGKVTVSLGIATFPDDADDFHQLVEKADKALYRAKDMGRNQTVVYEEIE